MVRAHGYPVKRQQQRRAVERMIRPLKGVLGITDNIRLKVMPVDGLRTSIREDAALRLALAGSAPAGGDSASARASLARPLRLHLADEITPIWRLTEEELDKIGLPPPFWAFAWAGGQALVRYVLDAPDVVSGKVMVIAPAGFMDAAISENVYAGTAMSRRLQWQYAVLLARNPRLVYGRMTGWGQTGPLANTVGHDINYLALTGALHSIGPAGQPLPPLNLVADLGGGAMYLAVGVLAAAMAARQSGQGQVVDAAIVDGVSNLMSAFQALRQHGSWDRQRGSNFIDGGAPFYGTYETRDGRFVAVGALEPAFHAELLAGMGLDGEALPAQYDRSQWPVLRARFAAVFRSRTRDEWVAAMAGRNACLTPVLDIDEAPAHPQMQARQTFTAFDGLVYPSPAPRFERTPASLRRPPPAAGEHSRDALAGWGLPATRIEALLASGAMQQAAAADRPAGAAP